MPCEKCTTTNIFNSFTKNTHDHKSDLVFRLVKSVYLLVRRKKLHPVRRSLSFFETIESASADCVLAPLPPCTAIVLTLRKQVASFFAPQSNNSSVHRSSFYRKPDASDMQADCVEDLLCADSGGVVDQ